MVSKLLQASTKKNKDDSDSMEIEKEKEKEDEAREYLTELTESFVQYLDDENVAFLIKVITPQLTDKNSSIQKKSFKVLASICEHRPAYVQKNFEIFRNLLVDTMDQGSSSVKKVK